jgi:hypothetical protein
MPTPDDRRLVPGAVPIPDDLRLDVVPGVDAATADVVCLEAAASGCLDAGVSVSVSPLDTESDSGVCAPLSSPRVLCVLDEFLPPDDFL